MAPQLPDNIAAIVRLALAYCGDQDPALVLGIIEHESNFNPAAYNGNDPGGGAFGLMQILGTTAQQMGFDPHSLFDPATCIQCGVAYLDWIDRYLASKGGGGQNMKIAAYNEGVTNALRGLPDLDYVQPVLANITKWQAVLQGMPVA